MITVKELYKYYGDEDEIKATIRADKDADGVNPINAGRLAQAPPGTGCAPRTWRRSRQSCSRATKVR